MDRKSHNRKEERMEGWEGERKGGREGGREGGRQAASKVGRKRK